MPMSFPNLDSLKRRAEQRGFRQPLPAENERQYREAFADWMLDVDRVESAEIRTGKGWDEQQSDPRAMLLAMGIDVDAMESDWKAETVLTDAPDVEGDSQDFEAVKKEVLDIVVKATGLPPERVLDGNEGINLAGVELLPHQQKVLNEMRSSSTMTLEPQSGKTLAWGRAVRYPETVGEFKHVRDVLVARVKQQMTQPRAKTAMELAFETAKQKGNK